MVQYLYQNLNAYLTPDVDMSKVQYYHVVYKNAIKLLNDQKQIDINKIKSSEYLKEKLTQLEDMEKKIKEKLKKKASKKLLVKLTSNKSKITLVQKKIAESAKKTKSLDTNQLLLNKPQKVSTFKKDLQVETIGDKSYIILAENTTEINKQIEQSRKLAAQEKKEKTIDITKKVNELISLGSKTYNNFMNTLNLDASSCNLLNKLTEMSDFGAEDYVEETEITDEDLDDLMAELDEMDEEDEEDVIQEAKKLVKDQQKQLSLHGWYDDEPVDEDVEEILDDLPDSDDEDDEEAEASW